MKAARMVQKNVDLLKAYEGDLDTKINEYRGSIKYLRRKTTNIFSQQDTREKPADSRETRKISPKKAEMNTSLDKKKGKKKK
jgi:hypothetical protein